MTRLNIMTGYVMAGAIILVLACGSIAWAAKQALRIAAML